MHACMSAGNRLVGHVTSNGWGFAARSGRAGAEGRRGAGAGCCHAKPGTRNPPGKGVELLGFMGKQGVSAGVPNVRCSRGVYTGCRHANPPYEGQGRTPGRPLAPMPPPPYARP